MLLCITQSAPGLMKMKRYNLKPETRKFNWGEMSVIALGDSGRGRHEELVPFHAPEDANYVELAQTKAGKPKIVQSQNSTGWLAVVSGSGCYTRGTYGTVYCLKGADVKVIAKGSGAYGDAGRIGGWNDFLVEVPEETFLKVRPAGGDGKIDRYWLYFDVEKVFTVSKPEMAMFCEQMGLECPPELFDELQDLASMSPAA
jgi:hypothetical protein